jgi:low temperature requirement protein LtrA
VAQPEAGVHDRATWAELFFDLVLAFAVTQTAHIPVARADWIGVGQAVLLLALMWWTWVGTTLAVHRVAENNAQRLLLFGVGLCVFAMAIAAPEVFTRHTAPIVFAGAYLVARALLWDAVRRKGGFGPAQSNTLLFNPYSMSLCCAAALLAGAILPPGPARGWIWSSAALLTLAGPALPPFRRRALVFDAVHLPERFATVIIIALGETVASVGAQASATTLGGASAVAVALVFAVGVGLWWLYFNYGFAAIEHALRTNAVRATLVRDLLSYGHFVLVAGLVLTSVGARALVGHPTAAADGVTGRLLPLGAALYVGTFVYTRWRMFGAATAGRVLTALLLGALTLAAPLLPELAVLALVAVALAALNSFEYWVVSTNRPLALIPRPSRTDRG